ncbi:MAG: hypothetical protein IPL43_15130 [Micropruina sp.]|nr:hypothetical protein [Micropruina sp.]
MVAVIVLILGGLYWLGQQPDPPPPGPTPTNSTSSATTPPTTPPATTPATPTLPPLRAVEPFSALRGTAVIDGDTGDWPWSTFVDSEQVVFGDAGGVIGRTQLMWDDEALYFYTEVTDDHLAYSTAAKRGQLWQGDGFTLELGPSVDGLSGTSKLRPVDGHYLFALNERSNEVRTGVNRPTSRRNTFEAGPATPGLEAVSTLTPTGYTIEGKIPWKVTGLNRITAGARLGANLNISDRAATPGRLGALISSNPQRSAATQPFPAYWQTLILQG